MSESPFANRTFGALLFDMDGTIISSVAAAERVWAAWAERHGLDVASFLPKIHGVRGIDVINGLGLPGIDAQAEVAAEPGHPVVPPTEAFRRLLEAAEAIAETELDQGLQRCALGFADQHLSDPGRGIVDIVVGRRNVVVASHREPRMFCHFRGQVSTQCRQPTQFVGVLVAADRLPVRHVNVDDTHTSHCRRDDPLVLVLEAGGRRLAPLPRCRLPASCLPYVAAAVAVEW